MPSETMNLLAAIETSSDNYRIAFACDRGIIFDSAHDWNNSPSRDIGGLVSCGLKLVNACAHDINAVTLNIGPGALSSIRAGVSFANALAFSLGIPIYPFNYFDIVAREARKHTALPVLCAIPAATNHAYVGLINGNSIELMRFGPLKSIITEISSQFREVAVAGRIREHLLHLMPRIKVIDTGIERPDVSVLAEMGLRANQINCRPVSQVSPLNEEATIFYEET
jgi:tRNA A37 threonylcarbamoyladenosine modification protein TsaB